MLSYLYIIVCSLCGIILLHKPIALLQQGSYRIKGNRGLLRELLYISIIFCVIEAVALVILFCGYDYIIAVINMVFLVVMSSFMRAQRLKVTLKYTPRAMRLVSLTIAINILNTTVLLLINSLFRTNKLIYCLASTEIILSNISLIVAKCILAPFEKRNNDRYIDNAKNTLKSLPSVDVIGITGSFGKTSIKNILYHILSAKFNVVMTKASYNTPLGVAISVGELTGQEDFFIVEMGARRLGDISYLVGMTHPKYGIISGITEQHIETMGNIESIAKAKYELYEGIPDDGLCVFNSRNEISIQMYNYANKDNAILSYNNMCNISDIVLGGDGSSFVLNIDGASRICRTSLLGRHNIDNIAMCVTLAYALGMNIDEIALGISAIEPIEHRLELIAENGINIIDDTYNANIKGVESALELLSMCNGRKIVATQGIVECGKKEHSINKKVGNMIASCADIVVVIGRNARYILEGLLESGFSSQNIFTVSNLEKAKAVFSALLRKGDYLLLTNDLPDNY